MSGRIADWGRASIHLPVALEGVTWKRGEHKELRRVEQWHLIVSGGKSREHVKHVIGARTVLLPTIVDDT